MSLLSAILGHASDVDPEKLETEFDQLLIEGEQIEHAYRLFRDLIVFTDLRLFIVDKQGITGKKKDILSVPYRAIDYFSKETTGHLDLDAELKLWIKSRSEPLLIEFKNDDNIHDVFRVLSARVLR